jgi:WhiB family redox-sensing transcriptional regulator
VWVEKALCIGRVEEFFYTRDNMTVNKIRKAKAICALCPVIKECDKEAKESKAQYGIWAGMTPNERRDKGYWP